MSQANLSFECPTKSDTNQAVQSQKIARGCTLRKKRNCTIYSENIGTGQLRNKISCAVTAQLFSVFCFSYAKSSFFHDVAHIFTHFSFLRGLATSCGWLEIQTFY